MANEHKLTLAERLDKLNEYERVPVTPDKLHDGRYFAGLFAGEHVAATEFVIGVLFVMWGVSAKDLIWGLILGNALAVLSWALICSPIATQTRLTLYWYVRRIIGPGLTVVYNFINAILYCCLAAAMIGVSASAVFVACKKMGHELPHPKLSDVMPNSVAWVVVVLLVGAVVVTLAIAGFKKLSQFASLCSPWMFMIFIAGAVATLPGLGKIRSWDDLVRVADEQVWTGKPYENPLKGVETALPAAGTDLPIEEALRNELARETQPNWVLSLFKPTSITLGDKATVSVDASARRWQITDGGKSYSIRYVEEKNDAGEEIEVLKICAPPVKLSFWHIMFFAWFCNLAMHVGLSDMAVFRYAKHWTYGFYSAFGMYLGHFVAWVCAGVMGAALGHGLNPGEMADNAAGWAGILAVLIAGWTTANPTIYRAGLALQIVTPNWPRWMVTLFAGAVTTVVGFFPAIFMQLLDFVAIYGLSLMPIGAVIVAEHWLFPRIGLRRYWTEKRSMFLNPAALISWIGVLVICFPIEQFTGGKIQSPMAMLGVHLFFRWLPGWFIAAGLYTLICKVMAGAWGIRATAEESAAEEATDAATAGAAAPPERSRPVSPVAWVGGSLAMLSLIACLILPAIVFLGDAEDYVESLKWYKGPLMIATAVYFVGAIVWMVQRERAREES